MIDRLDASGNQSSFDRQMERFYRWEHNLPEPLPDSFWNRFLQSLIERPDLRNALRAAMREGGKR